MLSTFTLVDPLPKPPQAPPPEICAAAKKAIRRNLFGSFPEGEIDVMLSQENKLQLDYLKARYNFSPGDECNEQISVKSKQFEIDSFGEKTKSHFHIDASLKKDRKLVAILPYARPQGIKRTFRVRKAHNGNSNVPIRQIVQTNNNNNNNNNNNRNQNNKNENHTKAVDSHSNEKGGPLKGVKKD